MTNQSDQFHEIVWKESYSSLSVTYKDVGQQMSTQDRFQQMIYPHKVLVHFIGLQGVGVGDTYLVAFNRAVDAFLKNVETTTDEMSKRKFDELYLLDELDRDLKRKRRLEKGAK